MKKFLFTFLLFSSILAFSQQMSIDGRCLTDDPVPATMIQGRNQMGNFTITDSDGVTRTLYDELDAGKTIMLDLFFTT